jgi:type IV secretion system protein TrbL
MCIAALLAAAAAGASSQPGTTNSVNRRAGVGHVKATPLFPVPASARVHGSSGTSTTSTTARGVTTTPATTTRSGAPPQTAQPTGATGSGTTSSGTTTPTAPTTAGGAAAQSGIPTPGTSSVTRLGLARAHHRSGGKLSTTALIGAVLAGLLVLLCAIWAIVRWLAIEPRWTRSLSYSLEEASFRTSATWAELLDWARIGR